jgi:hypothetical protein
MHLKNVVDLYLSQNFGTIEEARHKDGFSWKPILVEINHPELNPNDGGDREYVRNRFLGLRKKNAVVPKLLATQPEFIHPDPKPHTEVLQALRNAPVETLDYKYLDTYNKPIIAPKTEEEEFTFWKLEKNKLKKQNGVHIVLGCMHLPAINKPFFNAFLKFLGDIKPDLKGIHLIGDILDCKSLSSHDIGQVSDTTLEEEYSESNKYLDLIDELLPVGVEKNYLWGNHEERFSRLMKRVDMAKFGGALLSPTKGGKFVERGYTVQEDYKNAKIQLGKYLDLIHGEYITANAAKKHLDVYKKSLMFAHTHHVGTHFDCDKAAFNIGYMGDSEHPAFNYVGRITKSQWQNGFAVVNIDEDGFYHVQIIQWYNGRFFFGSKEYR